jgi:RHS repeat-associated protein
MSINSQGKELDAETGLYYLGARYYDPNTSIWLSVDPLANAQPDKTPYHFVSNNPINRIDPDGKWDIEVHAYSDRAKSGYAVLIVKDNDGFEVYRTVVKTIGTGGRVRNVRNSDTPQGIYKILGYRKTGKGTNYNRISFGPNDLLALDYQSGEGGARNGMHVHGGRQEGKYKGRKNLASTHGCMRINDDDMKEIKNVTNGLEKNDSTEKAGNLLLSNDLKNPVSYDFDRHNAGADQFPKNDGSMDILMPEILVPSRDKTYVVPAIIPLTLPENNQ